ncbi:MAG: transglycosylase SLT domain-containing protein, partial [Burkholderiaceae bacterium]|nr:transglycosylase SLT domain-containing protein [Burkholderiaceae bacterium]
MTPRPRHVVAIATCSIALAAQALEPAAEPDLPMPAALGAAVAASAAPEAKDAIEKPIEQVAPAAPPSPAAERPPSPAQRPATASESPGDLWERIRRGLALPDLTTPAAARATRWYADRPDYIARMVSRGSRYLFHIVEEIERRGMPMELALLPFVESAMQPEAESHAKAVGLWQFIPSTGKLYALEQNLWQDDRRHIVQSTRAALDYLQKLYDDFGDWQLALAAYNCGENCVARALARARAQRRPTDYASLALPRETQFYVPKLQALKNIVREPSRYGISLPAIRDEPYFVTLTKTRDIDVATAARLAELPLEEFRALNPAFKRPIIVGASAPTILLPADRVETFKANLAAWEATGQPLASWTAYTLRDGETLAQVAARVGVAEAKLREANRIPPRYRIAPRSTILIPRDETMDEDIAPEKLAAGLTLVPEQSNLRQITYRVRRGDTLASVARRWGVRPEEIAAWNNLHGGALF